MLQAYFVSLVDGFATVSSLSIRRQLMETDKEALLSALEHAIADKAEEQRRKEDLEHVLEEGGASGSKSNISGGYAAKRRKAGTATSTMTVGNKATTTKAEAMDLKRANLQSFLFLGTVATMSAKATPPPKKEEPPTQQVPLLPAALAPFLHAASPAAATATVARAAALSRSPERGKALQQQQQQQVVPPPARKASPSPERRAAAVLAGAPSPPPLPLSTASSRVDDAIVEATLDIKRMSGVRLRLALKKEELERDVDECKRGWARAARIIEKEIEKIRNERASDEAKEAGEMAARETERNEREAAELGLQEEEEEQEKYNSHHLNDNDHLDEDGGAAMEELRDSEERDYKESLLADVASTPAQEKEDPVARGEAAEGTDSANDYAANGHGSSDRDEASLKVEGGEGGAKADAQASGELLAEQEQEEEEEEEDDYDEAPEEEEEEEDNEELGRGTDDTLMSSEVGDEDDDDDDEEDDDDDDDDETL